MGDLGRFQIMLLNNKMIVGLGLFRCVTIDTYVLAS